MQLLGVLFLLAKHCLSLPQAPHPGLDWAAPNATVIKLSENPNLPHNATTQQYLPWPQIPFLVKVNGQPTSKLYFTYAGSIGAEEVSRHVQDMFQQGYEYLLKHPQRPGPPSLILESWHRPLTFRCQNRKTGSIEWSYHLVLDFLKTMRLLLARYQARYLELEIIDRRGYEDVKLGECELLGLRGTQELEQNAII